MSAWRLINDRGQYFLFSGKYSLINYDLKELKNDPEVVWWRNGPVPLVVLHHLSYDMKQYLFGNLFDFVSNRHGLFKITTTPLPTAIVDSPTLCDEVKKFIHNEQSCLSEATLDVYWDNIYFGFPDAKIPGLFDIDLDRRNPKQEAARES